MTPQFLQQAWQARRERSRGFFLNARNYKVCDQCRAIHPKRSRQCLFCGAYRFRDSVSAVRTTAVLMAENPFPITAPVVARNHAWTKPCLSPPESVCRGNYLNRHFFP